MEICAFSTKDNGPKQLAYGINSTGASVFLMILRAKSDVLGSCTRNIRQPGMVTLYICNDSIFIMFIYEVGCLF